MKQRIAVRYILLCALAIAAMLSATRAEAQTCTIGSGSGSYGTVNVLAGTAIDTTSTFTVSCTGTANQTVRLCIEMGAGSSPPGPSGERALTTGANFLDHEFYSDAARTQLWGSWGSVIVAYGTNGVSFDLPLGPTGSASHVFTLFARILAGQQAKVPGAYTWTGSSPGLRYGFAAAAACPTGSQTAISGGTTWTATIAASCQVSATTLNFGSTGVLAASVDSTSTLTATCTSTTPYNIGLNAGTGTGATVAARKMTSGASTVTYSLFTTSARTTVWGNTIGTDTVSATGSGLGQSSTVFGRVPAQTTPKPATYTDTIVVTITY